MRRSWLRLFWVGVIVVAAITAYLASTGLGERLLHGEIETQLTRLLRGPVEIGEVEVHFEGGLRVVAREIEAFPSAYYAIPPALRARRLVAWIDVLALMVGRLELSKLVLETPILRMAQDSDGRFDGLPLPAIDLRPIENDQANLGKAWLTRIESLDDAAATFLESTRSANRIEIQDGTILWQPRSNDDSGAAQEEIRLELVSTLIERDWISDSVELEASAVIVDGEHSPFPIGIAVKHRGAGSSFDWTVSMSQIPLEAAKTPLSFVEGIDGLSGQLTTAIHLGDAANGSRRLEIDGGIYNGSIGLRRSRRRIEGEEINFNADIQIDAQQLHLHDGHIEGDRLSLDLKGSVSRPIRPTSRVRIESRTVGIELGDILELVDSLKDESETAMSISRLTERVEGGRILYVEAAGTAPMQRWQDLVAGRIHKLPDGFVLGGAFEDIRVATGLDDRIEGLRGNVEWIGDQVTLRDTTASFRGADLPRLNLVLDGVSHLAQTPESERRISTRPPAIPGLVALIELLKPKDPTRLPPVKAIGLALDRLDHPIFRWPFRNLRVLIEPLRGGMEARIREGRWGGAALSGEVRWHSGPNAPTLTANLDIGPADPALLLGTSPNSPLDASPESPIVSSPDDPESAPTEAPLSDTQRWGEGRFELEFRPRPTLPFRKATGFLRLDGTKIVGNDVQFQVESEGRIASRIVLDLAVADQVGVDLSFALTDSRLEQVSSFIGLPPDLATGQLGATGTLRGTIRPGEPLIAELDGRIRAEAADGKIRTEVPLLLRLSKASEGYNPFASEDELSYESMTATIDFDQGSLLAEDFEIEGPLRIYARGRIDPLVKPSQARGVVGIFLFRAPSKILEALPLVRYFLPGSDRGLIGAYFKVKGSLKEPSVEALPVATLMTAVPAAIKAPFKVLQFLFDPSDDDS